MTYTEKGTVENFIIQELRKLGWRYASPEEMAGRRGRNFEEPLVIEDLKLALRRVNSGIELTDTDLKFAVDSLRNIPANIEGIERFLGIFRSGLVIPLEKKGEEGVVRLVDFENFENNEFTVTNQFKIEGLSSSIRADIVLLVNGIPLVLIECKSPVREEVSWENAYRQVKRYEKTAPEFFKYIQFSIVTDGVKTYYFPNAFNEEGKDSLSIWKDPYPFNAEDFRDDVLRITIYGLLSRQNLLDLIENFIFIRKERGGSTKIMARYQQFRASNKIFKRVVDTLGGRDRDKRKFGLIWHWQGSGKTYTMAFTARKLLYTPEAKNPSIFVIVDRRDLEEQIEKDFSSIGITIEKIPSIRDLIETLKWGREGKRGIFLVTIEKFSPKEFLQLEREEGRIEIKRENVVVLADEVHRTHYGKFATLMRSIFKNAFIFGFTGTPLSKAERNTFQKFSPIGELYLDRYSMLDSLRDGFTVSLSYQARLPQYHLKREEFKELVRFEEKEIESLSKEEQKELRRRIKVIKAFVKKPERIRDIAEDIAGHFKEIVEPTGLGALIVAIDREACVLYKKALDNFLPSNYSEVVMTFNPNDGGVIKEYYESMVAKYGTRDVKKIHQEVIDNFKAGREPRILIVTDMLITGFDAPILWTMYLDKPLKEHRVLQAIARANRPFSNKKFGLIVDYIGILEELKEAIEEFEAEDAIALRAVIRDLSVEKKLFEEQIHEILKIFENVDREDTWESLEKALNVLIDPEQAKKFESGMRDLMKSYEMLKGDPFLKEFLLDYRWLVEVYTAYNKKFKKASIDELKINELSKKTVKLIQETIDVKKIEDAYPTISIDEKYVELIKKSQPRTLGAAVDIVENIRYEARLHSTSPFFVSISKEVERTYEELRNRKIRIEEALQKLLDISERIIEWKKEREEIGRDKHPIYEAVKAILPEVEKKRIIDFTNTLLATLKNKKLLFKGWQQQGSVRREVRKEIRILLLSWFKDHRDKIDELTEEVFRALEEVD